VGSGPDDVAMILSEAVGREGKVTALDINGDTLGRARARATAAGVQNIGFVQSAFSGYTPPGPVDGMVGRFVLLYRADPVAALAPLVPQYLMDPSPNSPLCQHAADTLATNLPAAIELGSRRRANSFEARLA